MCSVVVIEFFSLEGMRNSFTGHFFVLLCFVDWFVFEMRFFFFPGDFSARIKFGSSEVYRVVLFRVFRSRG